MIPAWTLTKDNLPFLIKNRLETLDFSKKWEVIIQEKADDRTLEQNARLWKLYESIGNYFGYTKNEMHDLMGWEFLRYQVVINGITIEKVESTTKLSTKRMAWYQEQIEIWAAKGGWGGLD